MFHNNFAVAIHFCISNCRTLYLGEQTRKTWNLFRPVQYTKLKGQSWPMIGKY